MRFLLLLLLLTGCATSSINPAPSTDAANLSKLGDKIDISEQRAAAAVVAMIENKDLPLIVAAEGGIALAYLPAPTEGDKAFARERAKAGNAEAYNEQEKSARALQSELTIAWDKLEADNLKSIEDIRALKAENNKLQNDLAEAKLQATKNVWTITGAALVVLGGITCAFATIRVGIPILLAGAFAGSLPYILESKYFSVIIGTTLAISAALAVWWMYDKVRDAINVPDSTPK
jgi:hypothetical protein